MNNIVQQVVKEVSRDTNLSYDDSFKCVQASLRSLRRATEQHGNLDLRMFGMVGMTSKHDRQAAVNENGGMGRE
ncbi:hypothetical protein [Paenibacillus elgii]|uniref:hypothetical protein n=1 Tax=Paenibacillus elgii TaxID=189691 RepID=UPI0013D14468|nr:hypothetical protein [Paenibacillus elgii]